MMLGNSLIKIKKLSSTGAEKYDVGRLGVWMELWSPAAGSLLGRRSLTASVLRVFTD